MVWRYGAIRKRADLEMEELFKNKTEMGNKVKNKNLTIIPRGIGTLDE